MIRPLYDGNRKSLPDFCFYAARKQGGSMPQGIFGIKDGKAKEALDNGHQFVYFDHSYFQRGWHRHHFRAVRNGLHLTEMLDRPDDRMKRFGVTVEPWRKTGREVVIIPPSVAQMQVYGNHDWLMQTESRLSQITDRPVTCKTSKETSLREFLSDAWAVVTYASVAGVEAALMGVPVFSTDRCPSWPVCAGPLENIETPAYADFREKWAASLAYASWHSDEIERVKWGDYHYEML